MTESVTFGPGPGVCVGKPLAMLGQFRTIILKATGHNTPTTELRMATANLVRDVDLEFAPGYKQTWEADWQDFFLFTKGELPIIATPRV